MKLYTEINCEIKQVDHIEGTKYKYYDGSKEILVFRVKSEVFTSRTKAKNYFK